MHPNVNGTSSVCDYRIPQDRHVRIGECPAMTRKQQQQQHSLEEAHSRPPLSIGGAEEKNEDRLPLPLFLLYSTDCGGEGCGWIDLVVAEKTVVLLGEGVGSALPYITYSCSPPAP
mmetsp:Transcript_25747/g.29322  ORF Transcript_25747/g.29322 Transcript_25747/m.29322 type:complete len:116 (-) Transcript_25747:230-577(-)